MSSIDFRKGTPEDADGVARVWVTSWHEAYADLLTGEELAGHAIEHRIRNWQDAFSEDRSSLWVAERDGGIVGFLVGRPTQDADLDPSRAGEVSALYILADAHGGGVGKGLMDRGLADLAAAGFEEAALWVLEGNDNAIGFYEHTGWERDGGRKDCFGGANAPALRMRKPLN